MNNYKNPFNSSLLKDKNELIDYSNSYSRIYKKQNDNNNNNDNFLKEHNIMNKNSNLSSDSIKELNKCSEEIIQYSNKFFKCNDLDYLSDKYIESIEIKPYIDRNIDGSQIDNIPFISFKNNDITKCINDECGAYINPYSIINYDINKWTCNMCFCVNNLPSRYIENNKFNIPELTNYSYDLSSTLM